MEKKNDEKTCKKQVFRNCTKEERTQMPIYARVNYPEMEEKMKRIEDKFRGLRRDIMDVALCPPTLYFVPAPDEDMLRVDGLVIYGVSSLSKAKREALQECLKNFMSE